VAGVVTYDVIPTSTVGFVAGDIIIIYSAGYETVRWIINSVNLGILNISRTTPQTVSETIGCPTASLCLAPCCEQVAKELSDLDGHLQTQIDTINNTTIPDLETSLQGDIATAVTAVTDNLYVNATLSDSVPVTDPTYVNVTQSIASNQAEITFTNNSSHNRFILYGADYQYSGFFSGVLSLNNYLVNSPGDATLSLNWSFQCLFSEEQQNIADPFSGSATTILRDRAYEVLPSKCSQTVIEDPFLYPLDKAWHYQKAYLLIPGKKVRIYAKCIVYFNCTNKTYVPPIQLAANSIDCHINGIIVGV
jgi:hypothetical protein